MSRDASVEFEFGDGLCRFRLSIDALEKLQEARDAGPGFLFQRIAAGEWRSQDLVETIRWGLIGAGKTPEEARKLIRTWVTGRPLHESIIPALKILAACVAGPEDEPLKKAVGTETAETPRSPMESSASAQSMETEPS